MNQVKNIIIATVLVLTSGCSILGSDSDSNTFEAQIGNKTFKAEAYSHISSLEADSVNNIVIGGSSGDRSYNENLSFRIVDFDSKTGEYDIINPIFVIFRDGDIIYGFANFNGVIPSAIITDYDSKSRKIEGSFSFELTVGTQFNGFKKGQKVEVAGNFSTKISSFDE